VKSQLESLVDRMIEQGIFFSDAVSEFEKRFIEAILAKNKGNQSRTAKALGIHRNTLSRKIEEFDLNHRPKRRSRSRR
jgi:DNA-binding NtrC family response regulator